ncbi:helix-turn-helix domain-containing protein [Pectobacterium jejuense]|uniref:MarR family transcriptional regulator n=1 Tax=Pectobacterium TaxID=122277 RepID=UPI0013FD5536|nr:helix-turn-helix domain-containing protein [Pectobacterium polaris]
MKTMTTQQRVLRYVRRHEGQTQAEIARGLDITRREASSALGTLRENQLVIAVGTPGKYRFHLYSEIHPGFGVHPAQARFTQLLAGVRA